MSTYAQEKKPEVADPTAVNEPAAGNGRKSDMTRTIEGIDAQEAALAPDPAPQQPDTKGEGGDAGTEKLSPIREALLKQMEAMEGKGIGMKEFEQVCPASQWNSMKAKEDEARKNGKKPAVYTTCIDTQRVVSALAFKAAGLAVKKREGKGEAWAFGTQTREAGTELGAWVEASPGMGQMPKTGDMLMLEKAGAKADKLGASMAFSKAQFMRKQKRLNKQITYIEEAIAAGTAAKYQVNGLPNLKAALDRANQEFQKTKERMQAQIEKAQAATADRVAAGGKLAFSHVGFFKSSEPEIGDDGKPTGRLLWQTFDGGQSGIAGAIDGQGAMSLNRIYDPKTNFISGEASQGGAPRWLAGWIDADKLVAGKKDAADE